MSLNSTNEIDIRKQPRMGIGRTFNLTLNGIRYRLFRSSVTMLVILVAVAFLMNSLTESLVKKSVSQATRVRLDQQGTAALWLSRLSQAGSLEEVLAELAACEAGSGRYEEFRTFGGLREDAMNTLHAQATEALRAIRFLDGLSYAKRRTLVHRARGVDVFDQLQDPAAAAQFHTALAQTRSIRFPVAAPAFDTFLAGWPGARAQAERIRAGWQQAVERLRARTAPQGLAAALADADGPSGATIRDGGFHLDAATAARVATQARELVQRKVLEDGLGNLAVQKAVAARLDIVPGDVRAQTLWQVLRSAEGAEWYLGQLAANGLNPGLSAPQVVRLARDKIEIESLQRIERLAVDVGGGLLGLGRRMSWLLLVSCIVCMVGIANAMLMSVTERFREIATLKCLGALDGFIMLAFVFEAGLLGLVGGVVGAILGALIGLARMLAAFGWTIHSMVAPGQLALGGLVASVIGLILAGIAAVYPALKAARLAPMEAMRIE